MTKYNYCSKCSKWLGWPRFIVFWEKKKLCSSCSEPKEKAIEIF